MLCEEDLRDAITSCRLGLDGLCNENMAKMQECLVNNIDHIVNENNSDLINVIMVGIEDALMRGDYVRLSDILQYELSQFI